MGKEPSLSATLLELLLLDEAQEAALRVGCGLVVGEDMDCLRSPKPMLALLPTLTEEGFPKRAWDSSGVTEGTCSDSLVIERGTEYADEVAEDF